jgi:hypothetical protein
MSAFSFSSELKAASGNLTIPAGTTCIIALVAGATNPTIDGVAMTQLGVSTISISEMKNPPVGTKACVISQATRFIYCIGAYGQMDYWLGTEANLPQTLDTREGGVVFGIASGGSTANTLKGDGSSMTYLDNYVRAYKAATGLTMVCSGVSDVPAGAEYGFVSVKKKAFVGNGGII